MKLIAMIILLMAIRGYAADQKLKEPDIVCREFLGHFPDIYFATSGTQIEFTGKFKAIPEDVEAELKRIFPEYDFRIAILNFLHWGPEPVNLLLVVQKKTGRVCTYLWDLWFASAPFSFKSRFGELRNSTNAVPHISVLAKLIAFQTGWTVGEIQSKDGVITAPLLATHNNRNLALQLRLSPDLMEMPFSIVPFDPEVKTKSKSKP